MYVTIKYVTKENMWLNYNMSKNVTQLKRDERCDSTKMWLNMWLK